MSQFKEAYELIDFGGQRKLERFGEFIFDRVSPAAMGEVSPTKDWSIADSRYVLSTNQNTNNANSEKGKWQTKTELPESWIVNFGPFSMELKCTPFGHLGIFPEQIAVWKWINRVIPSAKRPQPPKILNLFAYTGGSSLAAASAGAEVVHIDSAKNIVNWARRNAEVSELQSARIRWIAEDALKFVLREAKRGNKYDGIILDPPTYGHGPKGEVWKIQSDLPRLLSACKSVLSDNPLLIALSCHTPEYDAAELQAILSTTFFGDCRCGALGSSLKLKTAGGRELASGAIAKWSAC